LSPVTDFISQTLFGIGSSSKAFLATAVGILIDDFAAGTNTTALPGNLTTLTFDTKMKDILPGLWELQDEWASEKASLLDILSHVSGLPRQVLCFECAFKRLILIKGTIMRPPSIHLKRQCFTRSI
jgi:hypothetical protein